ncbi:MAG: DUF177 domain-containing protein [Ruminococcaceae bacterium]|nr:DUF177 domain-containing protein [Oscillospiraceae bacterium]
MKLDMRPMLRGETHRIEVDFELSPFEINGAIIDSNIKVVGDIVDTAGYMQLSLSVSFDYHGECARCLSPVESTFVTEFVRTAVSEGTLSDEQVEDNVDEYVIIENGQLDIDGQICEELILDFPMRLLCSEDCPGLCPKCGKKKRDGDCGCDLTERDPRWDALRQYFNEENKNN